MNSKLMLSEAFNWMLIDWKRMIDEEKNEGSKYGENIFHKKKMKMTHK